MCVPVLYCACTIIYYCSREGGEGRGGEGRKEGGEGREGLRLLLYKYVLYDSSRPPRRLHTVRVQYPPH